jgi:putative oxidoreductase
MFPTHWMAVVGLFQLVGGLLVLSGRAALRGLALLAPILVNILLFHVFLDHGHGHAPGVVFSVLVRFLVYSYRSYFAPMFTMKAVPGRKVVPA